RGEAARDRPLEVRRDQHITDLGRPRGDEMQAVVTHGNHSSPAKAHANSYEAVPLAEHAGWPNVPVSQGRRSGEPYRRVVREVASLLAAESALKLGLIFHQLSESAGGGRQS